MRAAPSPLRVVLVEDSAVLRDLLAGMLNGIDGLEIVGFANSEATALEMLRLQRPALAIVDLELQCGTGLKVLAAIQAAPAQFGSPRTVVFSNHAHPVLQGRCRTLGALAFFDKSFQMDELLEFVQTEAERKAAAH